MTKPTHLIIADSEKDADLYYATGFLAPDSFVYLNIGGRTFMLMSDLELDRARAQAKVDEVIAVSQRMHQLSQKGKEKPTVLDVVEDFLKEKKVTEIVVPSHFPIEYADSLRKRGLTLSSKREPFFEERLIKSEQEIQWLREAQEATEIAVSEAIDVIRKSEIRSDFLYDHGEMLTSEKIKKILHLRLMEQDCIGQHTIVACGVDGVDPHNEGSGPLRPHQSIILDVFPRSSKTRYFADMTRTVVKGKASPKLAKMYQAVLEGQEIGLQMIHEGVDGRTVHQAILEHFEALGFKTGLINGRFQGFFHGTGHGVGLDIHEPPHVSAVSNILKKNQVVTVEPGLYYLDAGGVRLEDMVVVLEKSVRNLTQFPKVLEL